MWCGPEGERKPALSALVLYIVGFSSGMDEGKGEEEEIAICLLCLGFISSFSSFCFLLPPSIASGSLCTHLFTASGGFRKDNQRENKT